MNDQSVVNRDMPVPSARGSSAHRGRHAFGGLNSELWSFSGAAGALRMTKRTFLPEGIRFGLLVDFFAYVHDSFNEIPFLDRHWTCQEPD